jgi:5-formyltetrahydrofolate cyclo-ligase
MPAKQIRDKSLKIAKNLITALDWANINNVNIYSAVTEWQEVQTKPVIEYLSQHWPEISVAVTPALANQTPPAQQFDLIIVPCLAFDKELYRLGLGSGFYDRFLVKQSSALKVGLGFAQGLIETGLPRELHDVPLDIIVTEVGIMKAHDS